MPELLSEEQVAAAVERLPAWRSESDSLVRSAEAATFAAGIALVDRVALVADEMNHHPDIDIRWTTITFRLSSHSVGGVTDDDVRLAERIDRLVDEDR
jgi:4a-hydroxytetrahydrobiopterin dehydratase